MDFSVTVPQEWLTRRRSQVAEASRRIRARKKKEEEELREDNARLREERAALLKKITELEESLLNSTESNVDLENELLRTQLEQHKGFLRGFLETVSQLEPSETSSKSELSRQNRDFALMHAQRLISESQKDATGESWKNVEVRSADGKTMRLQGLSDYSIIYSRPRLETLNIRCDVIIPRVEAKAVRDLFTKSWTEPEAFQSLFGKDQILLEAREMPEFAVDDLSTGERMHAFHMREPAGEKVVETCFLAAVGNTVLSKSTLQLQPGRGPKLSQPITLQDVDAAGGIKRARRALDDPVDWGVHGTAQVHYGIRTVTGHGFGQDDENIERMMSTGMDIIFAWNEEIESTDARVAGPCTRIIYILSVPPDFKFQSIGGIDDFIDSAKGKIGERFFNAISNFVSFAILTLAPDRLSIGQLKEEEEDYRRRA